MTFIVTVFSSYLTYKLYSVFKEIKDASVRNKIIFIDEFKKKKYYDHPYTKQNYSAIKQWAESRYPQMEYIKSQDLLYASTMFRNSKNSKEYKQALKGKEEILKIYKEIEFDILRECFKEIIKIEKFIDDNCNIKEDAFNNNKTLFKAMSNDSFFSKKITNSMVILTISLFITVTSFIFMVISFLKLRIM